ncbi:MAG: exosortase/archaeosortase family protein [Desulfobulbus sp.]|jgi:exosortase
MDQSRSSFFAKNRWHALLPHLILAVSFVFLYYPVLIGLFEDWKINENYSHGFFIPIVSGYMLFLLKDDLRTVAISPSLFGLPILLIGLAQLYVGFVGSEYFLQRTSLVIVIIGIVLFIFGWKFLRKILFPVGYLLFMIPFPAIIWNKIAFPMQIFSSFVTEHVIRILGIPIFREGNILHLAQTTLEVVDACSGLRSLMTLFALAAALSWFSGLSVARKWILFLVAAPIAVLVNIVRLTATAGLASVYGEQVAQGFLHEFSGLFTFVFGLGLLVLAGRILRGRK